LCLLEDRVALANTIPARFHCFADVDIALESPSSLALSVSRLAEPIELSESGLIALLRAFVAIPTVSAAVRIFGCSFVWYCWHHVATCVQAEHRENCWRGAKFVQEILRSIGAENKLAQVVFGVVRRCIWGTFLSGHPALPFRLLQERTPL
jgi:hypothetical protein